MAEDVLGITGIVNIDDIQKTFDALIGDLDRLGVETEQISSRMTKALTDIANSSEKDLAAKTKAAMQVLNDAIAETNKQLQHTPETIKEAEQEVQRLQKAIATLEKQQQKATVGSESDGIAKQLENERAALEKKLQSLDEMVAAQQRAQTTVAQLQGTYDSFIAIIQSQESATQEATSATHENTDALNEQTQAQQEATQATQEAAQATHEQAEATQEATIYNSEFVAGLEAIAAKAKDMGGKVGGSAKQLGDSIAQNVSFVKSHLSYIEKTRQTLDKAIKSGDKTTADWAKREIAEAEKRVEQAAESIQSFMGTIESISKNPLPQTDESPEKNPRTQLAEWRNEIVRLTLEYRNMSEAERQSAEGQELKQKLETLSAKAAALRDAMDDVQETIKNDANDTAAFAGITQGLNLLISGFGAAEGAAAALGMSEEELARAQTVIQGSLAATNFLTEAGNALQSQSALMRGINTIQTWAAAKATDAETAAKGRNIIATKAASVAQGIFNAIAKANPYVLLAMAIVTVVGALAAFALGSKKASKAEEEHQKELERTKEIAKEAYDVFNGEVAKLFTSYQKLQTQWRKLSSEQEKQKWIKKNANEFKTLGANIDSTSDAEKFLVDNTGKVVESLSLRAQAAAYAAKAQKEYEKALSGVTDNYSAGDVISMSEARELFGNNWTMYGQMKKDYGLFGAVDWMAEDDFVLNQRGVDLLIERAMGPAQQKAQMWLDTAEDLKKQADDLIGSIGVRTVTDEDNDNDTSTKDKPKYKSAAELNDELLALTKERIDKQLEAEKEGTKEWERLMRERVTIQAEIDRRAAQKAGDEAVRNLDESYRGGKSGLNKQQYDERRAQLQQQTRDIISAIDSKEQQDLQDLAQVRIKAEQKQEDELIAQYQSYIDKKKKIDEDYAKAIADIDAAIAQATARGDTERVEALRRSKAQATSKHNEDTASLSLQQLKETPDYVRAFEDLGNTSTQTLQFLIQQFEEAKEAAAQSLDPEKLREYTSTLQQMYDAIQERDPWAAMKQSATELANAENRLKVATLAVATAKQRVKEAERTGDVQALARAKKELADAEEKERKATDDVEKSKNKYNKAQKAALQQVNELANAIAGLGDAIGGTEGQILGIASGVMTFMTQTIEGIKAVTATGVAALSTLEKASVILAIISAAIQLFQKISSLYKDAHAQYEEYAAKTKEINDLRDAVNEYRLAVLQATQAERKWFASTGLQNLRDMYEYSNMALEQYVAKMLEAQAIYQNESGGGWLTNALKWIGNLVVDIITAPGKLITGALDKMGILGDNTFLSKIIDFGLTGVIGKGLEEMMNSLDAYEEGTTAAFKNLRIETRSSSSGFLGTGIGGHSQRTEDLVTWAKDKFGEDLFDSNGFINTELANTILDKYGDKLVGETKETLEELVKLKEEYDKFREQLQEYVSDMFSPLTEDMTDALWDWLKEGKDVMDSFKKYASDTFADIAKEMIKQALLQKVFDGFQDKLTNLYEAYSMGALDEKTLADGVMQATDALLNNAEKQLPMIQDLLTYIDEKFKERGFDITGSEAFEQSASSKAWQTMSQDSADELNGRFTALYECGLQILDYNVQNNELLVLVQADISQTRLAVVTLSQNMTELLDVQYDNLNKLDEIIANTAPLPDMAAVVEKIYNAVKNVNKK